jgi:hypothetical protein
VDTRLEKLRREIGAATAGLSPEQLSWHPAGKWCAAEVLEHLYLTYTGTIKGFERFVAAGQAQTATATWAQRRSKLVVLGMSYLPSGREAPQFTRPKGLPVEKVRTEIEAKIAEMDAAIALAETKMSGGKLLDHPILGPLTGAEWRKFHLVHGLHHVKQIWKLQAGMKDLR